MDHLEKIPDTTVNMSLFFKSTQKDKLVAGLTRYQKYLPNIFMFFLHKQKLGIRAMWKWSIPYFSNFDFELLHSISTKWWFLKANFFLEDSLSNNKYPKPIVVVEYPKWDSHLANHKYIHLTVSSIVLLQFMVKSRSLWGFSNFVLK